MQKSLKEVKAEIEKILIENNCKIMSLYDTSDEQEYSYLIRKISNARTEQLNIEL